MCVTIHKEVLTILSEYVQKQQIGVNTRLRGSSEMQVLKIVFPFLSPKVEMFLQRAAVNYFYIDITQGKQRTTRAH